MDCDLVSDMMDNKRQEMDFKSETAKRVAAQTMERRVVEKIVKTVLKDD